MKLDSFAQIAENDTAENQSAFKAPGLKVNKPMAFDKNICELKDVIGEKPINVPKSISTKEELYDVLEKERKAYEPFLQNFAPQLPVIDTVIPIENFLLDDTKEISIPYYGGPLGNARQKYTSEFEISQELTDKAVYICVGGADYHASVYINDYCVGMHEGFFSPFEFEITDWTKQGKNELKIMLQNDYVYNGNSNGVQGGQDGAVVHKKAYGDKLYAATGLGYDDPEVGWHHCPPGMGIYNYVRVEIRNRINITDVFVRPIVEKNEAEVWIDVQNADYEKKTLVFSLSVYGQNFKKTVIKDFIYEPYLSVEKREIINKAESCPEDGSLDASHGSNIYKINIDMTKDMHLWDINTPYLYQLQVKVYSDGKLCDAKKQQFGMRSFSQDTKNVPKGMFYLNGRKIKLRGANTMGFEQQDVIHKDFKQLVDDILLAKICNMNFWRITQRPVQDEVYEYCDKLGLMTQSDLPLFGVMRRNKFAEGVRQTEEMIKMVRKHPCNIVISYINEPFACGAGQPHRNMVREELEDFFEACDRIVKLNHPDCVIKYVDGDYDAPARTTLPDNHCYSMWYNGHGGSIGWLYRGYWRRTLEDWYYACGEFGAEGLDFADLMKRRYPERWLKEPFSPANITNAQTFAHHSHFYDTPSKIEEWVEESQKYQAFATKMMTEIFRRDPKMISYAVHLFIDAWPSGWMKTIMDCERNPKKAYFAYRDACAPLLITLRSDRFTYFENENISIETYVSNDFDEHFNDFKVNYELYCGDRLIKTSKKDACIKACDVTYIADAEFVIPKVDDREKFVLKAILLNDKGEAVSSNEFAFEVFQDVELPENENTVIIDDLQIGSYEIAGEAVEVCRLGRGDNFISCKTGHKAIREFEKNDFSYWYSKADDMIMPLADKYFVAEGFNIILKQKRVSSAKEGELETVGIVAEKCYKGNRYIISTLDLRLENPIAKRFKKALLEL